MAKFIAPYKLNFNNLSFLLRQCERGRFDNLDEIFYLCLCPLGIIKGGLTRVNFKTYDNERFV